VLDGGPPLRIALPPSALTDAKVASLKNLLSEHPGESPVYLQMGDKTIRLAAGFNVDCGNGLMGELRVLLGASALIS
jgi:DNA polymerase III subunit alpha